MGQVSGIVFIVGMDSLKSVETGSMTLPLVILIVLMILSLLLSTRLKEAQTLLTDSTSR
jgi:ACR3 family arsenite efflux pump ArsB